MTLTHVSSFFISALEDNFIDTTEAMKELSDQDYKDMGFPIGVKNAILKKREG